jgi:BlaI family penicillinase repressor
MGASISESEKVIMEVLWKQAPLTVAQIVERVMPLHPWSEKTIQTFINRLRKKKLILEDRREVLYLSPAVTAEQAKINEASDVLQRLYGGSLSSLLMNYLSAGEITRDEADELIRMLSEYKDGRPRHG